MKYQQKSYNFGSYKSYKVRAVEKVLRLGYVSFVSVFGGRKIRDLGEGKDLVKMIQISKLYKTGSIHHSEFIEIAHYFMIPDTCLFFLMKILT